MRRLALILAVAVTGLLAAGCGSSTQFSSSHPQLAITEGTYLQVGGLTYQIQISRYLNPSDIEDRWYLLGLPAGTPLSPGKDDIWFGVWMRVKNYSKETLTPTSDFTIVDTQGNKYKPISQAVTNPFTYKPVPMHNSQVLPQPSSPAGSGPIQGALILFKLKIADLPNRPFVLHIANGAAVQLDL